MLRLFFKELETYDEKENLFSTVPAGEIELEHSLVSVSKWEAIHKKAFLGTETKTYEEIISYLECMAVDGKFPPELLARIDDGHIQQLSEYINSAQTATWFGETKDAPKSREVITAEVIYYWMIHFNIPVEFQYWHLNRLLTLVRVCGVKQEKPKKMGRQEAADQRRMLNEQRKKQFNTRG